MTYETLKSRIRGAVITSFDPEYPETCDALLWNARKPKRRARVIVRAADAADVRTAVAYAAAESLSVSARTGGHQFTGIATQADMVIDLGRLDGLRVDTLRRTAEVGPAVTNSRLVAALDAQGLAFPVGHCGSVPMGGYLLGGGVGWNSGAWGFACESVTAVDVVLADGSMITATAEEHADVFWAARGAGPEFFGIVTGYRVALQEAPRAMTAVVRVYPAAALAEVAAWAERAVARAPATVEFTAKVDQSPAGPVIAAIAVIFAATEAEAQQVCAGLAQDAPSGELAVMGPMPASFQGLYDLTGAGTPQGARYGVDCYWSEAGFGTLLAPIIEGIGAAPSPRSFGLLALRSNAGAAPEDCAFSRAGRLFGTVYGVWDDEDDDARNLAWLRGLTDACGALATGAYVGEADLDRPGRRLPTLSEEVLARLSDLRCKYDPGNRFRPAFTAARAHAA